MRWRRITSVFCYWTAGEFVVENYRTGVSLSANPVTARVLHVFDEWCTLEEAHQKLPEYNIRSVGRTVQQLTREGLLVREGSRQAADDQRFAEGWSYWLPHAAILHFGTKDAPYSASQRLIDKQMRSYLEESPPPAFFKPAKKNAVSLPEGNLSDSEFTSALLQRRTHREFSPGKLELKDLSILLSYTWGVTGSLASPLLGLLPRKTSPSAGARHPCEVYILARRVKTLAPGIYHYAPNTHALEQVSAGVSPGRASQYCAGQKWVERAAALFLISAVFHRSMWKYRFPRAYRTVLLDAGHLCQTFCLVATHLRLAPFCTMALKDSMIEADLGIDGINESILYVAGVGLPLQTSLP
jgi:SagB-type dehydrogenase family enzyme